MKSETADINKFVTSKFLISHYLIVFIKIWIVNHLKWIDDLKIKSEFKKQSFMYGHYVSFMYGHNFYSVYNFNSMN